LDHYEEGTWDPILKANGTTTLTVSWKWGSFVRVGNICHVQFSIGLNDDTSFTSLRLDGLPYPCTMRDTSNFNYIELIGYEWQGDYGDTGGKTGVFLQTINASSQMLVMYGLSKADTTDTQVKSSQRWTAQFSYTVL
jgi:hypothetical protein